MKKAGIFSLSILTILFIYSCGKGNGIETHEVFSEEGTLTERYERRTSDYAKQGLYEAFYDDGITVMESINYENDTMDGLLIRFNEKGDTASVATIEKGVYQGEFREYFPEGGIMQKFDYVDGKMTGWLYGYHETGVLKEKVMFADNNENGPFTEYYANGNKSFEGNYLNGKEQGELSEYNENGELIRKANCENGVCLTTWKKEGTE